MKTRIATLLTACLLMLGVFAQANEPVPASKDVSSSIAQLIADNIDYPDFARISGFECCVLIRLSIQKDGKLEVECANCKDNRLRLYVEDHIQKISVKEFAQYAGQTIAVKLVFRLIE